MNLYKKKNVFSAVFLFSFFIYAVSPLSYTFAAQKNMRNFSVSGSPHCISENINIFFWELICENLVPKSNTHQSDPADRMLFKKVRAILPEDINTRIVHAEDISLDESLPALPASPVPGFTAFADTASPLQDCNLFYSGSSPPSA